MSVTNGGTQLLTADGAVGTSGNATRVYSVHVISTSGGACTVLLKNGTSTGGTSYASVVVGAASTGASHQFGTTGMYFTGGCFVDIDANTASVAVSYVQ